MIRLALCLGLLLVSPAAWAEGVDLLQKLYGARAERPSQPTPSASEAVPAPGASAVSLFLKEGVTLSRERVYGSDLVRCAQTDRICQEILAIDFGIAPRPQRQESWLRDRVASVILAERPELKIEWDGARTASVTGAGQALDEAAVRATIESELTQLPMNGRAVVTGVRVPSSLLLRHRNYTYRIPQAKEQLQKLKDNPRTRFALLNMQAVDMDPASQAVIDFQAQLNLRIEIQALVTTRSLERGEKFDESLVELQWVPYQEQVLADAKVVQGKSVRSRLMSQAVVRSYDLVREPEVQRGERIEAMIGSGGVKMNSVAQALEPGFIGQRIRIRLEATKKNTVGIVVARSQVEVPSL